MLHVLNKPFITNNGQNTQKIIIFGANQAKVITATTSIKIRVNKVIPHTMYICNIVNL